MNDITFEDVLSHYQRKLKEAYDDIESIKTQLKKAQVSIDDGWKGSAATACYTKLEATNADLVKTQSELSEALIKLSAIGELQNAETPVVI